MKDRSINTSGPFHARAALVTGASSGIGEAFARALAARSTDVLLTARPQDEPRLREIASELASAHGVRAEAAAVDLGDPEGPFRLQQQADDLGIEPDLLVNSAGLGVIGAFGDVPLRPQLGMIQVNVDALVALTGLYLPRMLAQQHGAIINVASTAGLLPVPYFAVYAATKAFVISFSEAVWAEHRHRGIRVVATCPGPVRTRFQEQMGVAPGGLTAETVVTGALRALDRNRPLVVQRVPPFGVFLAALSAPIAPRRLRLVASERLARWFFRPSSASGEPTTDRNP